jgi:TRAP-type C4-dicarboxylate transport system substrate-binding protein
MEKETAMTVRALLLGFVVLATVALAPAAQAQTLAFKCATATLNDVQHEWCKRFGARLEQRTGGRIKPQVFPASQLGSIPRMIEGVQLGTIEAWIGPPEFMVGVDPRFQVLTAPYLFDGMDHAHRVINEREFLDRFLGLAEGKGIRGVALIVYGPASFVARTPVRTPDDLRGKKIRVLATPIESAMMAQVGATGVPMTLGEVLPALQQGALDGVQSALTVFTTFKYYDVAKYHTNTDHYFITSIGTVSKRWLDGLPPDVQKAVLEEGRALHAEMLDWTKNFYQAGVKTWKEKTSDGWIELTAPQRSAFRSKMEGVDAAVAEKVPGIKEWLELLRAKAKAVR